MGKLGAIPEREAERHRPHLRMAAVAQTTQSRQGEVVTLHSSVKFRFVDCKVRNLKHSVRNNWRASLVPAAAVIPAPIAYIKVAAVEAFVVEFLTSDLGRLTRKAC